MHKGKHSKINFEMLKQIYFFTVLLCKSDLCVFRWKLYLLYSAGLMMMCYKSNMISTVLDILIKWNEETDCNTNNLVHDENRNNYIMRRDIVGYFTIW